jgi:hypothetical protein
MALHVACQDTLAVWEKKNVVRYIAMIFAKFTLFYNFLEILGKTFFLK